MTRIIALAAFAALVSGSVAVANDSVAVFSELRGLVRTEVYDEESASAWGELTPAERAALARAEAAGG